MCSCASRAPTSAAPIFTCTKGAPASRRAKCSATRTSARSSRSATPSCASRSATASRCRSTSPAASAGTASGANRLLPHHESRQRGRRVRLRRDGPVQRRPGRVSARALRGLQLPAASGRRRGEGRRLRACSPTSSRRAGTRRDSPCVQPGRLRGHLRRRARRSHGGLLGDAPGRVSKVMVVDRHPDRLALAESIGAIAIDDSKVDPVER